MSFGGFQVKDDLDKQRRFQMPIKEISIRNTVFREKPVEPRFNPSYEAPHGCDFVAREQERSDSREWLQSDNRKHGAKP